MELYSIPDELVAFLKSQFIRFKIPIPRWEILEIVGRHIIKYVAQNHYFPTKPDEAIKRFHEVGLSHPEKVMLIGPAEIQLAFKIGKTYDIETLHLTAWAALLWCWSEEGTSFLVWYARANRSDFPKTGLPLHQLQVDSVGL